VSSQGSLENDFSNHAEHMQDEELKYILRRQYKKVCVSVDCMYVRFCQRALIVILIHSKLCYLTFLLENSMSLLMSPSRH